MKCPDVMLLISVAQLKFRTYINGLNSMKRILICLVVLVQACTAPETADLILTGRIYTANDQNPLVTGVAVKAGKIVFAGDSTEALKLLGKGTKHIELGNSTAFPGFIEGHGHFLGVGYQEMRLDLRSSTSYEAVINQVKEAVSKATPGQWIIGRGWHQDKWSPLPEKMVAGFPVHQALSAVSPANPVLLEHASGHLILVNEQAMKLAGISALNSERKLINPPGGEIILDPLGNPTGIFNERASLLIESILPIADATSDSLALELATKACWRNGITSFQDAGISYDTYELYRRFRESNRLKVRIYAMISGTDARLLESFYKSGPLLDSGNWFTMRSIKLYGDGALGSRGAWLLEPYTDRHETSGMATISMDSVYSVALKALHSGLQVCTHAIGDRANREVLNAYERAFTEVKIPDHRFRIEHAQHVDPADLPRFAALGVYPAMQAIHMSSDRPWAINRLGEQRIREGAYMWQTLLKSGTKIINGTDAPVEPLNPIASFYASVTRQTLEGKPEGGFEPEERMTRQQALKSYTLDAAFGSFDEKVKGSIEVGKLADFTIFNQDIMSIPTDQLLKTRVVRTIVNGEVVFENL